MHTLVIMFTHLHRYWRAVFALLPLLVCTAVGGCNAPGSSSQQSLDAAHRAYMQMDLDESRSQLSGVLDNRSSSSDDKVSALQSLAAQDWLFYQDRKNAIEKLHTADSYGIKQSATWQTVSRIERESSHFPEAQEAARNALLFARGSSDSTNSRILLARAIHDESVHCLEEGAPVNRNALKEASRLLYSILEREPGRPLVSQMLFGACLMLQDGPTALKAWQSYFHVVPGEPIPSPLREPGATLTTLLPSWKERPLSAQERASLVAALSQSRFFDYAVLVSADPEEQDRSPISPEVQEVRSYREYLNQVRGATEDFYRRTAVGGGRNGFFSSISSYFREMSYRSSLKEIRRAYWNRQQGTAGHPDYDDAQCKEEMNKRFGLEWWLGTHNRYYGLLAGHRVLDTTRTITQYGFQSNVRYVSVDMMVSDGYSSWFWDGQASICGTASESTIYQFRPAYVGEPYGVWEMVSDPVRRSETEKTIAERGPADDSLARVKPSASLSGLGLRLRYAVADRILGELRARRLRGPDLCLAFVAAWERLTLESSIFAHEGRHLIDNQVLGFASSGFLSPADMEYRAKLSEVIFSQDPRLAFSKLITANGGDASPHGQAEERIMNVVVRWIDEHKKEVAGFDSTRPSMPQFDLLADDQIRTVFRQVDPMADRK